jgi:hypothetical protein
MSLYKKSNIRLKSIKEEDNILNELEEKYNLSSETLKFIIDNTDNLLNDNKIDFIEFGTYLINIVPKLIELIRDADGIKKVKGKDREKILIDVLSYVLKKYIQNEEDQEYYINLVRTVSPSIIKLAFQNPKILKHSKKCFLTTKNIFKCFN